MLLEQTITQTVEFIDPPVREKPLPFCLPDIREEEIAEVIHTLQSGWITTGPKVKEFEQRFAAYVGARHAIAVHSCTGGLEVALAAANIGPGDEVIVPTMTFCATANVVVHRGATPVLVDVEADTLNLNPLAVRAAITPRTKAIMPVHMYGHPVDLERIELLAAECNLSVIEDAAHAVAAEWKGTRLGSLSRATVFSFYATKNLTTAEGGMITTNDDAYAAEMRIWALHGMSHDAWKRYGVGGSWYYEITRPGLKCNMTDIQAALGLHQLERIEWVTNRRAEIVAVYNEAFAAMPALELPAHRPEVRHAWHLYPLRLRLERLTIDRDEFIRQLQQQNIGVSVHFIPLHRQPYYRDRFNFEPYDFPVADEAYQRLLSLPLYPIMTGQDVEDVIEAVRRVVTRYSL
jgi:dTDP-4-amino-4,6-dideoxygalactose transaminase